MSITDELRGWYSERVFMANGWHELDAIADRIDAEHEREMQRMWDEAETFDFAAFEATHIELPKDADGVPIHVGDKLRFDSGMIVEVRYLKIDSEGTSVCVLATNGGGDFYAITEKAHHYHAPTVEDVLRELVSKAQMLSCVDAEDELIAQYAIKLQLAESE